MSKKPAAPVEPEVTPPVEPVPASVETSIAISVQGAQYVVSALKTQGDKVLERVELERTPRFIEALDRYKSESVLRVFPVGL